VKYLMENVFDINKIKNSKEQDYYFRNVNIKKYLNEFGINVY
jgi:hypothetical protein